MVMTKRKRYLVKRAFQLRYTGMVLFFIYLTVVISSLVVYLALFPFLSEKLASVYPQARLVGVLKAANTKLYLSAALLLPIAAWFGIILSHRIAGPLYRLENILRDMAQGRLSEVRLRERDELHSLAEAINGVTRSLRFASAKNQSCLQSLDATLRDFEEELKREPIDLIKAKLLLSKLQDISTELRTSQKN